MTTSALTRLFLDHEAHVTAAVTAEIRLMPYVAPVAWTTGVSPRLPQVLCPGPVGVMIRAHMRGVTEIDFGCLLLLQGFDLRVLFLQPLLDERLAAFQGAMQRLLAGDAELSQKPPHRDKAQGDLEFVLD